MTNEIVEELQFIEGKFARICLDWGITYTWVKDSRETQVLGLQSKGTDKNFNSSIDGKARSVGRSVYGR